MNEIILRRVGEYDLDWLMGMRNNPELRRYFRQHLLLSYEDQVKWFKELDSRDTLAYISSIDNNNVGYVSLSHINWVVRHAEFGIFIDPVLRGKGIGFKTMQAILKHGFEDLNLNKIYSDVFLDNPCLDSNFYDKLGFKREGILRQQAYKDGKYIDSVFIGILKDEYFKEKVKWESKNVDEIKSCMASI